MDARAPLICLITPGHVASTPRLVKNADALTAAGYRVHVVCRRHYPPADPLDAEIFARVRWSHTQIDEGGARALAGKLLRRTARERLRRRPGGSVAVAARAHQAAVARLAAVAARLPASLYFGHCLAGLPAAAFAARRRGVAYGFDAEDFHDAETEEAAADPAEAAARTILQSRLLPGCAIFTTASPLIARQYAAVYGRRPTALLNVFPLAEAPAAPVDPGPAGPRRPAQCYWFSQTVGAGRGLEAMVPALAGMRTPVELVLRGFVSSGYAAGLQGLAARCGLARPVRFLPPARPAEMVRLAAGADLGLSIEESQPLNRDLCLTNKIFAYLLAGLPQLLSATAAQSAFAPELGSAGLLGRLGDPEGVARTLDEFLADSARVATARRRAWELGRSRFCWDREKEILLGEVRRLLPL
jgi:hypothetical protein